MTAVPVDRERPIAAAEQSCVLYPNWLARYQAGWITPDPAVSAVVDQYWHVSWALNDDEQLDQPIIDLPAFTLTVEEGNVPAPLVVTGLHEDDGVFWLEPSEVPELTEIEHNGWVFPLARASFSTYQCDGVIDVIWNEVHLYAETPPTPGDYATVSMSVNSYTFDAASGVEHVQALATIYLSSLITADRRR
ncbi:hypothetical protein FVP60_01705 [Microbacterium mitrae]|uniref:Uncharacterized protein n=1 Tax=Microbacterium mitrae TaxID=664640 RepID=A0A5C8HQT3_9MICO|nr:hypothetical protein [Microbacterium mitrae]TXK05729.1 hypothetical protein FVP60_01705 [Microbacterium mitrae]